MQRKNTAMPLSVISFFLPIKSPVNFSAEIVSQAQSSVQRLYNCEENLRFLLKNALMMPQGLL
jgi:hypothetical protein